MTRLGGFTVLELLITIVISAGMLLWVGSFSQVSGRVFTATRLDHDAQLLLESMNQYYHRHCTDSVFPTITSSNSFLQQLTEVTTWRFLIIEPLTHLLGVAYVQQAHQLAHTAPKLGC